MHRGIIHLSDIKYYYNCNIILTNVKRFLFLVSTTSLSASLYSLDSVLVGSFSSKQCRPPPISRILYICLMSLEYFCTRVSQKFCHILVTCLHSNCQIQCAFPMVWIAAKVVKLSPLVEGDQKAPFSIATTRCRGRRYFFPWIRTLYCWVLSKEVSSTIFKVFGMTQPGIEARSPRLLANILPTRPMSRLSITYP